MRRGGTQHRSRSEAVHASHPCSRSQRRTTCALPSVKHRRGSEAPGPNQDCGKGSRLRPCALRVVDRDNAGARCCFAKGDLDGALKSFERAAAVDPTDFQTWALISSIHEGAGRTDLGMLAANQAIERAMRHLEHHPDNARAAYMCAGCLFSLGRKDESVEWLEKPIAVAPDDPGVIYNVACLYSRLGQLDRAFDALEKSIAVGFSQSVWIQHDPDLNNLRSHPRYQEILKRLS